MNIIPNLKDITGLRKALSPRGAKKGAKAYAGTDAKVRAAHKGAVPIASEAELEKARASGIDLRGRVKPFDRYGRRRVFDVAHHTGPNRAERRALKRAGYNVPRATNRPLERGAAR